MAEKLSLRDFKLKYKISASMPETHNNSGEMLIDRLLARECTSSNLQTALVIAVAESSVKLPPELAHQLIAIGKTGNIPFNPTESNSENLRVQVEALRIIFRQMIIFIMACAQTQGRNARFRQRIEKIIARYGIKAPWAEEPRDSVN